MDKFLAEFEETMAHMDQPEYFDITGPLLRGVSPLFGAGPGRAPGQSRGQLEGPISFGLNVKDQDDRPILFDDTVRPFMLEFMAHRVNTQLARLKQVNPNAFMFIDEPGLQFIFSGLSGYGDVQAAPGHGGLFRDHRAAPGGCISAATWTGTSCSSWTSRSCPWTCTPTARCFTSYTGAIKKFLERGGVLVWRHHPPPTWSPFSAESLDSLYNMLLDLWSFPGAARPGPRADPSRRGSYPRPPAAWSNPDGGATVEKAFKLIKELSERLRGELGLE